MFARALLVGSVFVVASSSARADQCQLVDPDHATWAAKIVVKGATVAPFCESCGDAKPGKATSVASIAVKPSKTPGKKTVAINGKDVDLAYTYLQTGKTTWANLGVLVGCPVTGSTAIYTEPAPTTPVSTGVPECDAYFVTIDKMMQCPKMQQAASAMRDSAKQTRDALMNAPASARSGMAAGCKAGDDAIKQSLTAMGC